MQQLLEQSLHSDSWSPVKIKFNWDASYWTKQMSSLGKTCCDKVGRIAFSLLLVNVREMYSRYFNVPAATRDISENHLVKPSSRTTSFKIKCFNVV